ncbi:putative plastid-lipid-associated protein 13 [Carex littledalei]|uniref:Putative plastid-lipid-associated protein 13 n=1 Tax=Carex littledalei TaxID=544730 RepID=A0A833R0A5_9POAL|nr:putative plastid-lipid-associated protein 13 [Carex littledalei]
MAVASTCPYTTLPWYRRRGGINGRRSGTMVCRAAVQQETYRGGPAGSYAREMERLSAKESLLLAFKDAGGFQSLVTGKTTEMQKIDVNERIVGLERLSPTTRPTTSPFLEGRWNFEWIGDTSPESFIMRFIFERAPSTIASLIGIDLMIKDGYSKIKADLKFLNSIESKVTLTTKLTVEGPMRMREEYSDALLETPSLNAESLPGQLKPAFSQAAGALQQLPAPLRDTFSNGLRLPFNGSLQRLFMISYLDEEILIIRDAVGAPDVLTRLEGTPSSSSEPIITEYES